MELNISEQKENPLLSRTEVAGSLAFNQATPSNAEVQKSLASKLKVKEQLIVVKKIGTKFGARTAMLSAYIYKDVESLKRIEPPLGKKAAEKQAKKDAEAKKAVDEKQAAETPKEEAKA